MTKLRIVQRGDGMYRIQLKYGFFGKWIDFSGEHEDIVKAKAYMHRLIDQHKELELSDKLRKKITVIEEVSV